MLRLGWVSLSLPDSDERHQADAAGDACRSSEQLGVTDTRLRGGDGKEGSRDPADTASSAVSSLAIETTTHPALIPQELAGTSRQYPLIPATRRSEALLLPEIPAYPRSARKRHDRPVTPEVAGSSPVALVKFLQISIFFRRAERKRPPASFPRSSRT